MDSKVLQGKKNFLFLHNDSNSVLSQHTGQIKLSEYDLQRWMNLLSVRSDIVTQKARKYYFVVCPDNHAIYSENLPDNIELTDVRPVHQILGVVGGLDNLAFIYPLDELKAAKNIGLVSCTSDSHVTFFGGFVIYQAIMRALRVEYPNLKLLTDQEVEFGEADAIGDLGIKLVPQFVGRQVYSSVKKPDARLVYDNGVVNRGNVIVYENSNTSLPSALLFRDSYGMYFIHYLAESFSKLTVVATPLLDMDVVNTVGADVIISELAERFLISVPDDALGDSVIELIDRKT